MSMQFKDNIRLTARKHRQTLPLTYQESSAEAIIAKISALTIYLEAQHIALYKAINCEVDLNNLWHNNATPNKHFYFPKLVNDTMVFLPVTPATLFINNSVGIPEPKIPIKSAINPNALDIIFLPLLAFDNNCNRIGYGKGYYDRTLHSTTHPYLIGVAYELQRIESLQPEPWDIPMHAVITENTIYWRQI